VAGYNAPHQPSLDLCTSTESRPEYRAHNTERGGEVKKNFDKEGKNVHVY
jgi:hypothetical protein